MTGDPGPYDEMPYFWSDLADWATLEYVGPAASWDREVVRGSFDDGEFTVFYLDGGQVAGALTVGRSDDLEHAKRLMSAHTEVDADTLAERIWTSSSRGSRRAAARTARRRRARCGPPPAGCRAGSTRRRRGARSPRGPSAGRARW